ncbi:hypothetical protein M426DRAFT_266223 [Hypoxylon sp. CI-4A]|nr:hypothetical protein M426DRAFT_266223 [Hypoxylon sp. CI-4A]
MPKNTKNPTRADMRTRSGCRKCRERRVKCPEERPVCGHCKRLGFICRYEFKLTWQDVLLPPRKSVSRILPEDLLVSIQSWMFLNTEQADFDSDSHQTECDNTTLSLNTTELESQSPSIIEPYPRFVSLFRLGETEGYLWSYFSECMAPQIVIDPSFNPYRDILLKMAVCYQEGPLIQCVLAAAANQLHIIGKNEYASAMWLHRARALRLLRLQINQLASEELQSTSYGSVKDEIIASTLMLTFFEISKDCSSSWMIHANFARSFLFARLRDLASLSYEQERLLYFAITYFVSHDILATTAGISAGAAESVEEMCQSVDKSTILALTGCSRDLLILISEINQIGVLVGRWNKKQLPIDLQQRRDTVERRLHQLRQEAPESDSVKSEFAIITEMKRLAAILYFYSRVDHAGPHEPHMIKITDQILSLVPKICIRTHSSLWPLFIVATMGIRPECDEDRRLLLGRLAALQQTRQLASVKKARLIIEDVWKTRDLKPNESRAWDIVLQGRRHGAISLA